MDPLLTPGPLPPLVHFLPQCYGEMWSGGGIVFQGTPLVPPWSLLFCRSH